ncbi:hypothetical protein FIBSPDRAFT_874705 [Athelia psychrophila]|uniref:Uncharacterized protein n=1 Tax=Athelia psychrophila TaxID=1759441 RepID=A0A165X7N1_9AGAM|nr:hypothetical protein FIBSPDRAFT_874705 [Fibularhizoctonia sp. CBS 109695]
MHSGICIQRTSGGTPVNRYLIQTGSRAEGFRQDDTGTTATHSGAQGIFSDSPSPNARSPGAYDEPTTFFALPPIRHISIKLDSDIENFALPLRVAEP